MTRTIYLFYTSPFTPIIRPLLRITLYFYNRSAY